MLLLSILLLSRAGCAEANRPTVTLTVIPAVVVDPAENLPLHMSTTPAIDTTRQTSTLTPTLVVDPPTLLPTMGTSQSTTIQSSAMADVEATLLLSPPSISAEAIAPNAEPAALPASGPTAGPTVRHVGDSAGGRPINDYRLGRGATHIVLVGGIHGGYEWNSILLAQEFLAYFVAREKELPASVLLHVIPVANPDGLAAVTGEETADLQLRPTDIITNSLSGRLNANGVDINRNWDCLWTEQAYWRDQRISAGAHPFSEPEAASLSSYILKLQPALVIFLHSVAGAVYTGGCPDPDPASSALAAVYGLAAQYPVYPAFTYYSVTGDAGDWLTTQGIPSFTVELSTREATDWEQNLAGLQAILHYFHVPEGQAPENRMNHE